MIRSIIGSTAAIGLVAVAGCEATPTEELVSLEFNSIALVDVVCDDETGECQGDEVVDATLTFKAGLSIAQGEVEFLQYEATFDTGENSPPSFDSPTQIRVLSGTQRSFAIRTAGVEQRDWAARYYPQSRVEGTGTLTLYGYDQANNIVAVSGRFDVVFDDFLGGGDTTTTEP